MTMKRTEPDVAALEKLLLGQLPVAEAERLAVEYADDHRLGALADALAARPSTMIESLRSLPTAPDPLVESIVSRVLERLHSSVGSKESAADTVDLTAERAVKKSEMPESIEYFQIRKKLGEGGMGTVYLADDTRLGRRVALKTLRAELAAKPTSRERFLREARSAAMLEHDHVIPIYYVGEVNGTPFLAMPYLHGEPLDARIERERIAGKLLPVAEAIRIARQIAAGLTAAHAQGLIHRDIKPANVWLEAPTGRVKILDFGLARSQEENVSITQSGIVIGTPAYMAPEQGRALPVDHRADLFSLGSVLYEMLTCKRPFVGSDAMSILTSLAIDTPTMPHEINPACPLALSRFTMRLLAKQPEDRPPSAQTVVEELVKIEVAAPETTEALPATPRATRKRRVLVPLLLVVAMILVPLGWWLTTLPWRTGTEPATKTVPSEPKLAKSPDADRKAAGYVLSIGGVVWVNDETRDIKAVNELPKETFRLTRVDLRGNQQATAAGLSIFADCENLTALDLRDTQVGDEGLAHFKGCTKLRFVDLEWTSVNDAGLATFKDCENLELLELSHTQVGDAGLAHFKGCRNLKVLGLAGTKVGDDGLANFKDCANLQSLELSDTKVGDAGLIHFKDCKNLNCIALPRTRVTDIGLACFRECKHLEYLRLSNTSVGDAGMAHFAGRTKLQELDLANTQVTDVGLANFKGCTNLTRLELYKTKVSDAGTASFQGFKNLDYLRLSHTQVTNTGLANFKECKNLTRLELVNVDIDEAGLEPFKECKKLTLLRLNRTKVSAAGSEGLKKALLGCQIEWDGGVIAGIDVAAERKAAEYVLSIGGRVKVNDQETAIRALNKLPTDPFCLTAVELASNEQVTDEGLAVVEKCKLTSLDLTDTRVTDAGLVFFKDCPNLMILRLSGTQVSDGGLATFKDCKKLEELGLLNTQIGDAGVAHFKDCKQLKKLMLDATRITDAALLNFQDCTELEFLALLYTAVGDAGLAHLRACKQLQFASLGATNITDATLDLLMECKGLKTVLIGETEVTKGKIAELKKAQPKCIVLPLPLNLDRKAAEQIITLGGAVCINDTMQELRDVARLPIKYFRLTGVQLKDNPNVKDNDLTTLRTREKITWMDLSNTKVTGVGFADADRKGFKGLTSLNLSGTKLTEEGLAALASLQTHKELNLKGTKASADGIAMLQKALPDCKISSDKSPK